MTFIIRTLRRIDPFILLALLPLTLMSLSTLHAHTQGDVFFVKQLVWYFLSYLVFFLLSQLDFSFLKQSRNVAFLYAIGIFFLILVLFIGAKVNGARSWLHFGPVAFQPADLMKFILIITFAKFLAKRHVAIASFRYIFFTFVYFIIPFVLIFIQPDFGSALILIFIWFGLVMISGLSKKHFFAFLVAGVVLFAGMWSFVLKDYQKDRVLSFVHPLSDIQGAGYNAYQSTIAVGSGKILGKGIGYGTQSRLAFLPEYETDFIFAAIAEEWGIFGALLLLVSFLFIVYRILSYVTHFSGNFERLFAIGFALYLFAHFIVNVGMNIGLMPITGVALPFVSYGGSHLLIELSALGILMAMRSHTQVPVHKELEAEAFLR